MGSDRKCQASALGVHRAGRSARRGSSTKTKLARAADLAVEVLEDRKLLSAAYDNVAPLDAFRYFKDREMTMPGLTGSYISGNMRSAPDGDWTQMAGITINGTRTDPRLSFPNNSWGVLSDVGLSNPANGTDSNWENYSAQWDGYICIDKPGTALALRSDDAARMWISADDDITSEDIYIESDWSRGHGVTTGLSSAPLDKGVYRIRVQYYEGASGNQLYLLPVQPDPQFFQDASATLPGIQGHYINHKLTGSTSTDWTMTESYTDRVDPALHFVGYSGGCGWGGSLASVGLSSPMNGSDSNWDNFSVQWDGYVKILRDGTSLAMSSDDASRMWIDVNGDGNFDASGPEFINNNWGVGGSFTSPATVPLAEGTYKIRVQYTENTGANNFHLGAVAQPTVRIGYVVPSDRQGRPGAVERLKDTVRVGSDWFKEQMQRNGYAAKSFTYETDADGSPKVYTFNVPESAEYLRGDAWGRVATAAQKAGATVWFRGEVWLLVPEIHVQNSNGTVSGRVNTWSIGGTAYDSAVAMISSDFLAMMDPAYLTDNRRLLNQVVPEVGPYPLTSSTLPGSPVTFSQAASVARGVTLQHLAGALGLAQEGRNIANTYHGPLFGGSSGGERAFEHPELYPSDDLWLSPSTAAAMNVSRYFNPGQFVSELNAPAVSYTAPSPTPVNGKLQLSFTASDASGLALAQLWRANTSVLVAEAALSGTAASVTLTNAQYNPGTAETYNLVVYDVYGNRYRSANIVVTPVMGTDPNRAPIPFAYLTSTTIHANEPVLLDGSRSTDPNGTVDQTQLKYEWLIDLDSDGDIDVTSGAPSTAAKVYQAQCFTTQGQVAQIQLRVTDPGGASTLSEAIPVRVMEAAPAVPAPWASATVGTPRLPGFSSFESSTFTIRGPGENIWGTGSDQFQFVFQPLHGNGSITARVIAQEATDPGAMAGIMIRQSLDSNSAYAYARVRPGYVTAFDARTATAASAWTVNSSSMTGAPYWLRLVRRDSTIMAYVSADGVTFTPMGSTTVALADDALVGLAVTARNPSAISAASFDCVTVLTAPTADAGPAGGGAYTVPEGGTVTLDGSASSNPGQPGAPLTYLWDLDGDGRFGETGAAAFRGDEVGVSPVFRPAGLDGPSVYTVLLRVQDTNGILSSVDSATVNIVNTAPTGSIGGPGGGNEGSVLRVYVAQASDPAGNLDPLTFEWSVERQQADGTFTTYPGAGPNDAAVFNFVPDDNVGFRVSLTIRDDDGGQWTGVSTFSASQISNVAPWIRKLQTTPNVSEGNLTGLDVYYNDNGPVDTHVAVVNWGDGNVENVSLGPIGFNLKVAPYFDSAPYTFTDPATQQPHYYYLIMSSYVTWQQAEQQAQILGGHLATITSDAENTFVTNMIKGVHGAETAAWIGLSDAEEEGVFRWATGEICNSQQGDYTNWNTNQPDDYAAVGGEDYVATNAGAPGKWSDGGVGAGVYLAVVEFTALPPILAPKATLQHRYADDGTYMVSVSLRDKDGAVSNPMSQFVTVLNAKPVITDLDLAIPRPDWAVEGDTVTLNAAFTDAGVLDTHTATVDWGDGSAPEAIAITESGGTGAMAATQHKYLDEGVYHVVLTITDADGGMATRAVDISVNNARPVLTSLTTTAPTVGSLAAGSPMSLSGAFTDLGMLDLHSATVNWGDGLANENVTLVQGAGSGTLTASHVYPAGGIYEITLTVRDDLGDQTTGTAQVFITGVGIMPVPETPWAPAHLQLQVIGTAGDDHVTLNQELDGSYIVHGDFLSGGQMVVPANPQIQSIVVAAGDGNDRVVISGGIRTGAMVFGGAGNDQLNGGNGPNAIFGDEGDDMLIGGNDNDLLIGGIGADRIVGNGGADQLVAGRDDRFVLSKYAAAAEFLFSARRFEATEDTHDDAEVDVLTGSAGIDRFFASLDTVVGDIITDKAEELFAMGRLI